MYKTSTKAKETPNNIAKSVNGITHSSHISKQSTNQHAPSAETKFMQTLNAEEQELNGKGTSGGAIAGIVICVIIVIAAVVGTLIILKIKNGSRGNNFESSNVELETVDNNSMEGTTTLGNAYDVENLNGKNEELSGE